MASRVWSNGRLNPITVEFRVGATSGVKKVTAGLHRVFAGQVRDDFDT
jgi:hypothetical protein